MAVNLTTSSTSGFVALDFPVESGSMVGAQSVVRIPQNNMIVKDDLKGYSDQAELPDKHQIIMDASIESVDGDIVLKFKKFLVEGGK